MAHAPDFRDAGSPAPHGLADERILILRSDPQDRVSKDGGTGILARPPFETPLRGSSG